jgi:hypothetical protein
VTRVAVFGYASLVSRASAAETLGREVGECPLVRLRGWRRRWSLVRDNERAEKTFARADDGTLPPFMLGLNIEPAGASEPGPNGALIGLTEAELDRLDVREVRYDRVDVTDAIDPPAAELGVERVITYRAKPERFSAEPPAGAVILRPYLETVEAAFAACGPEALDCFRETTGPPPVEVIDAVLVRDEIPEGNPRAW